jgi:hypothetical protein
LADHCVTSSLLLQMRALSTMRLMTAMSGPVMNYARASV